VQDGRTALHLAILHGLIDNDMDVVRLLINYGANVNVKDEVRHRAPANHTDNYRVTVLVAGEDAPSDFVHCQAEEFRKALFSPD